MQFGIFSVGDITPDPTTGREPSEAERIKALATIAEHAEQVGLDVFAVGEHHNRPFVPSAMTTLLGWIAARTDAADRLDLHRAHHHQRPGADGRGLRDAAAPQRRARRPRPRPRQRRPALPLVREGPPPRRRADGGELPAAAPAVGRGRRRLGGAVPHPAAGLHLHPAPPGRGGALRVARLHPDPADRRDRRATSGTGTSPTTSSGPRSTTSGSSTSTGSATPTTATAPPSRRSSASAGRCSCGANSQDAVREFRPYFDNAPVYGHGPSLEEFTRRPR